MSMSLQEVGRVHWENRTHDPPTKGCFLILPYQTVSVGRDETRNHVAFSDAVVSRCQLEIFSIIVDEEDTHPPLVFVRDRGSSNGTAVNGQTIGRGPKLSASRLLEDGDVITIGSHPHLTLKYVESRNAKSSYHLSYIQRQEIELFKSRYIVSDHTIGDGGHAVVFLATEVETGQHVVCKIHDISKFSQISKTVERIRREAALLSTLDHPNILPIRAAFETDHTIYVMSELATGGDLFSLLLRFDKVDEWPIRSIIRQVLRGVAYLHSKGVAHRDIKPENILCGVTPQVPYRIMLSDFGDSGIVGRKRMRSAVGTPFYRAPECYNPDQGHGLPVDIWAVGMLTLQLFVGYDELPDFGRVQFRSQQEVDTYLASVFAALDSRGPNWEAGRRFVCDCLAFDSGRRPTASQAFRHDWLQEPESDRKMFERLEADNAVFWKPQRVRFPVIEDLRAESLGRSRLERSMAQEQDHQLQDGVSSHFRGLCADHDAEM